MIDGVGPIIETPRLWLRVLRAEDVDALMPIFTDPKVMASFSGDLFNKDLIAQWVKGNLDHYAAHGYGAFSVIHKESELLIGDCALELMDVDGDPAVELGYDFRSDFWNQGYATEAAQAVRNYAFEHFQLPRLISLIRVGNLASRRVAEKVGMRCVREILRYGQPYWLYQVDRVTMVSRMKKKEQ